MEETEISKKLEIKIRRRFDLLYDDIETANEKGSDRLMELIDNLELELFTKIKGLKIIRKI